MKHSLIKLFVLFIGLTFTINGYAQENFVSGYVIKLNGDTLKGLIDYRNWSKNPTQIKFKEKKSSDVIIYKPIQISAFGASNEIYKSATVKVDNSNNKDKLSTSPVFEFRTDTVFLQTLFQGSKSLYLYKDKFDKDNFYKYDHLQYELLEFKTYLKRNEAGNDFLQQNNRYIGQLLLYFQDCPGIDSKLKDITYKIKSLQNIYQYYYSKMTNKTHFSRTSEKIHAEFGAVGGLSMIDLKFSSSTSNSSFDYLTKATFDKKMSFAGGVFMNLVFPRNNGKWSLYNELYCCSDVTTSLYTDYHSEQYYQKHDMKIGSYYLKINNMIRYKYPIKSFFCFLNAGFSNGYAFKEVNSDIDEDRIDSSVEILNKKVLDDTTKYEQALLLGLGIINKKLSVELRYEGGTGMSLYPLLASNAHRFNLLFGYKF